LILIRIYQEYPLSELYKIFKNKWDEPLQWYEEALNISSKYYNILVSAPSDGEEEEWGQKSLSFRQKWNLFKYLHFGDDSSTRLHPLQITRDEFYSVARPHSDHSKRKNSISNSFFYCSWFHIDQRVRVYQT
jgi:hypothetical protein